MAITTDQGLLLHELGHCAMLPSFVGRLDQRGYQLDAGINDDDVAVIDSLVGALGVDYAFAKGQWTLSVNELIRHAGRGHNAHDLTALRQHIDRVPSQDSARAMRRGLGRASLIFAKALMEPDWLEGITAAWCGSGDGDGLVIGDAFRWMPYSAARWLEEHRMPPWPLTRAALAEFR